MLTHLMSGRSLVTVSPCLVQAPATLYNKKRQEAKELQEPLRALASLWMAVSSLFFLCLLGARTDLLQQFLHRHFDLPVAACEVVFR